MSATWLGVDLGTSAIKLTLIDENQRIVAASSAALDVLHPQSGWSEQAPEQWIAATESAMDALCRSDSSAVSSIVGIGLSGQMHGATLLDKSDRPLRPCILWNDTRAHLEAAELDTDPRFRAITGNIVFPGFTAPKLVWVSRHEPQIFEQVRRVLLPKDYLRLWLTGEYCSDMSDAAGTSWLDTGARRWSDELLSVTGLDHQHMPSLVEGSEPSGRLRKELATRWGMSEQPIVAGGAGDNAASAIGMGVTASDEAFVSLGTSGVLFSATDRYRPNPQSAVHAFCHALPDTWHQMGVILSATDALNWLASITGKSAQTLTANLGESLQPPGRATFLPYLSGERTPHNDAKVRGVFAGIEHATDHAAMTRALLEGVAFALRDSLDALAQAGTNVKSVIAVGGGAQSIYWLKAIATALNVNVEVPGKGDYGAAFGAARLGLLAATSADPTAICTKPVIEAIIEPEQALGNDFEIAYQRYRALYLSIRELS